MATAVQTELANRGYYHGSIDGAIGPGSRDAIRAFQRANNLPVTGLIDPPLLKALRLPAVPRVGASE
jgi:peptidoglycan hydrolase-like protein with peptidoglycan-binding domain